MGCLAAYNLIDHTSPMRYLQDLLFSWQQGSCFSWVAGVVTSLVISEEEDKLQNIAKELGIELVEEDAAASLDAAADVNATKQELEDLYNLM